MDSMKTPRTKPNRHSALEETRQATNREKFYLWIARVNREIARLREQVVKGIDWFVNYLFETTVGSGRFRRWLFIVIAGVVWGFSARVSVPIPLPQTFQDYILYPFPVLFSPVILRHVIIAFLGFWLALQIASHYLDDVFELENPEIAERYILQASLANRYPNTEIKEGQIKDEEESTIVRVGGPGLVRLHYDSAALFEKFDGEPTVLVVEDEQVALDRFERLRKIVRLKDHHEETGITERTRDGIPISANGIIVRYYIHRDETKLRAGEIPYPVVRSAVQTLVYDERVSKSIDPIALRAVDDSSINPETKYSNTLEINPSVLLSKLRRFISDSTLGEFLASISDPEMAQREEDSEEIEQDVGSLTGVMPVSIIDNIEIRKADHFFTRDKITDLIYGGNDQRSRLATGLQLEWIDIGTWVLPEKATQIAEQHQEAWKLSLENRQNRSEFALQASLNESKMKTTRDLLQELIFYFESTRAKSDDSEIIKSMLNFYRQKLLQAQELYRKEKDRRSPLQISKVISYLNEILGLSRNV